MDIIGLDFGNCYTYPLIIDGMDEQRAGGSPVPLFDSAAFAETANVGIPSSFFFAPSLPEPIVGMDILLQGIEVTRTVNRLKSHMGEHFEMGGRTFDYDDAIVKVVESSIREANSALREKDREQSTLISLAYPVTFSSLQKRRLIELVERATLEDGNHLQVVGTIMEPAAAALQFLSEKIKQKEPTTALVYDLGGGTFDVTALTAHPQGFTDSSGSTRYYREHLSDGIAALGGEDFTKIMRDLIEEHVDAAGLELPRDVMAREELEREARRGKHTLSNITSFVPRLVAVRGNVEPITREEFEDRARPLIQRTVEMVKGVLNRCSRELKPETIVLTGGASAMPIVKNELAIALDPYGYRPDDINLYMPSTSIALGAARFGVIEPDSDLHLVDENGKKSDRAVVSTVLSQVLRRDIGVRYCRDFNPDDMFIKVLLPKGSELPCLNSAFDDCHTIIDNQRATTFTVFEAESDNPNCDTPDTGWRLIGKLNLDHRRPVPRGFALCCRLVIDADGVLRVEAYEKNDRAGTFIHKDLDWDIDEGGR